jgi:hypothetical protein
MAVVCVCVLILVCDSLFVEGSPSLLSSWDSACDCKGPEQLQQLPRLAALDFDAFSRRFPPPPQPIPLAHSAFPRQGPAAPSSFLLNHLLTLKSKPILV